MSFRKSGVFWSDIREFTEQKPELIAANFNPYDFAIQTWKTNKDSTAQDIEKRLEKTRTYAMDVANECAEQLETNAKTFVRKTELLRNIDDAYQKAEVVTKDAMKKFTFSSIDVAEKWKKTLKYKREIEILDNIEILVNTPQIVTNKIETNDLVGAANDIITSLKIYNDNNFDDMKSLSEVKNRLDQTNRKMINYVIDSIFNELFVKTAPNITFFGLDKEPHEPYYVDVEKIKSYSTLLRTLYITDEFLLVYKEQITERLSKLMTQTANSLKVKHTRQYLQARDGFDEIVEVAETYNKSNSLLQFIDILLAKLWVLLARAKLVDEFAFYDNQIFEDTKEAVDILIREVISTFTTAVGTKANVKEEKLKFTILQNDSMKALGTTSTLRQDLNVRASAANSLRLFPLITSFREMFTKQYQMKFRNLPNESALSFAIKTTFSQQEKQVCQIIEISRPVKTELHPVPILICVPKILNAVMTMIAIAERFPYLEDGLVLNVEHILKDFQNKCEKEIDARPEEIYTRKLVNSVSVKNYHAQEITRQLVLENSATDVEEYLPNLAEFEERNEDSLMRGSIILKVEQTVREKFCLPTIAAIAESLTVVRDNLLVYLKTYTLRGFRTVSESSASQIGSEGDLSGARERGSRRRTNREWLEKLATDLDVTIVRAMAFLHVEMRCRTYAEIVGPLTDGNYNIATAQGQTVEREKYVDNFESCFKSTMDNVRQCLTPARLAFVFAGIPRLVYDIHIRALPRLREINERGSTQVSNNLKAFNIIFQGLRYPETAFFKKALVFATNISYSTERILKQLQTNPQVTFTYEEMEPVFNMQQKMNERHAQNLEQLRKLLKK